MKKYLLLPACILFSAGCASEQVVMTTAPAVSDGDVVFSAAANKNKNPFEAGKASALALKAGLSGQSPHIVLAFDCFESRADKARMLDGVASVFPRDKLYGGASYGVYTQEGVFDQDSVGLLGIAGNGLSISAALEKKMGASGLSLEKQKDELSKILFDAGARLAKSLPQPAEARIMLLISDAHSPKNQLLLDGVQSVTGKELLITGGSVNKNAGQNWVYHKGRLFTDSAVAIAVNGNLKVAQAGRQAKMNDAVISTAKEASGRALADLGCKPFAVLTFDCAGRKGKLNSVADELSAILESTGKSVPLFGCYCAGEYGPSDSGENVNSVQCFGKGWHIMVSAFGR